MSNAPVCNVSPPSQIPISKVPQLPNIPIASDPQSTMAAVNAIRNWINQFTLPSTGTVTNIFGASGGDFVENTGKRVTTEQKISDPNDPETYVVVSQITSTTWTNKRTGQTIVWNQAP